MTKNKNIFGDDTISNIINKSKNKKRNKKNLVNQIKEDYDIFLNPIISPKNNKNSINDNYSINDNISINDNDNISIKDNTSSLNNTVINNTTTKEIKDNIRKNKSINMLELILNDINIKVVDNTNEEELKNSISLVKTLSFNKTKENNSKITESNNNIKESNNNIKESNNNIKENNIKTKENNIKIKERKKNKINSLHPELDVNNNIKFDEIKDLSKKLDDIGDYHLIQTPFKMIGEELLNEEINIKYKSKIKLNPENNQIIKRLKDNFKKLVYHDKKDKPNLSKIILDQEMTEDVKIKILRKLIRFTTEDEVFSEDADKIKSEINNLIKLKKIKSSNDYDELWKQIVLKEMPHDLKSKLEDMYYRIITGDQSKLLNFINNVIKLPYHTNINTLDKISEPTTLYQDQVQFINSLFKTLDEKLFGLNDVKNSIISFICQKINNPTNNSTKYLCLCGPAGVGKTSIVNAISEALNIPFAYISLANIDETSSLIGHSFTYEGSMYGCIADALIKNSCNNGILLFDEIDKCKEKIQNTLLGIFDPLQNNKFRDAYFGNFYLDLSKSMMILCLNELDKINPILRDRLHIVNIPGYNIKDKKIIIEKYILPKLCNEYKLEIYIDSDVINNIIEYTKEQKGIRQLIMYLTKIYELMILDKYTQKFNFENKFLLKDIKHLDIDNIDKSYLTLYS